MSIKSKVREIVPDNLYIFASNCKVPFSIAKNHNLMKKALANKPKNEKIRIVFIVQRTEVFNSVKTIIIAASKNPQCEVYLLPIPRYDQGSNKLRFDTYQSVYDFCTKQRVGAIIDAYDAQTDSFKKLEEWNPDYVFLNIPYTQQYPAEYRIERLAQYAKVCYVPYGFSMTNEKRYRDLYTSVFGGQLLNYASFIFCDGKITRNFCKDRLFLSELFVKKSLYLCGYPRFDLLHKASLGANSTVLWIPRWTSEKQINENNLGSCFFRYKDKLVDYGEKQEGKVRFLIRPHPLAFDNYIASGVMTEKDVAHYKNRIKESKWFELDENDSYEISFNESGILLADYSSIIIEFFYQAKPIIYCGSQDELSDKIKYVTDTFYYVSNWEEVEETITNLINGIDPKSEIRKKAVQRFRLESTNAGKRILDVLIEDYDKNR